MQKNENVERATFPRFLPRSRSYFSFPTLDSRRSDRSLTQASMGKCIVRSEKSCRPQNFHGVADARSVCTFDVYLTVSPTSWRKRLWLGSMRRVEEEVGEEASRRKCRSKRRWWLRGRKRRRGRRWKARKEDSLRPSRGRRRTTTGGRIGGGKRGSAGRVRWTWDKLTTRDA